MAEDKCVVSYLSEIVKRMLTLEIRNRKLHEINCAGILTIKIVHFIKSMR